MADSREVLTPGWRATDDDGQVLPGAYLMFFEADTDTPRDVYSDVSDDDIGGWVSVGSTVTCDAGGYPTSDGNSKVTLFVGTGAYKVELYDADDVLVWSHDFQPGAVDTSGFGGDQVISVPISAESSSRSLASDDRGKLLHINCTGADVELTLPSAASLGDGWRVGIRHEGTANQVIIKTTSSQLIRLPGMYGVVGDLTSLGSSSFGLASRGQEIWIRCDGAGFSAGEYNPPVLNPVPVWLIEDRLNTPPVSPQAGARYIVTTSPTGDWSTFTANDIVEFNGQASGWIRYQPSTDCGWIAYVKDEDINYQYSGTSWITTSFKPTASDTVVGDIEIAVQSEMETATSTTLAVTPGRQKYHPLHAKAVGSFGVSANILEDTGIASITDDGDGRATVTWDTAFTTTTYPVFVTPLQSSGRYGYVRLRTTTAAAVGCDDTNTNNDPTSWNVVAFGDL